MNQPELTDVEISGRHGRSNDWVGLTGTATLAEDLFIEPNEQQVGESCGVSADAVYRVRGPWGANRSILVLERGPSAGALAEFDFEIVARQVEVGDMDSDGDVYGPEDVTTNGWTWGAFGGEYEIDGVSSTYLGWPADFYGGVEDAVFVGTPEFEELCEELAAAESTAAESTAAES
jgi:hypothetical protein